VDFILTTATIAEPNTVEEALITNNPYNKEWYAACKAEVEELLNTGTFKIIDTPTPKPNILGGRWIFKLKPINIDPKEIPKAWITDKNNKYRFKARWVV
jgi:hypothetical protein